jgi:hypothetical protein
MLSYPDTYEILQEESAFDRGAFFFPKAQIIYVLSSMLE